MPQKNSTLRGVLEGITLRKQLQDIHRLGQKKSAVKGTAILPSCEHDEHWKS